MLELEKRMVQWLARFVDDEKTFVQFKLRLINIIYIILNDIICYNIYTFEEAL